MSRKVKLILNGKSAGHDALQAAIARQRAAGHTIDVRVTSEKGDARGFMAETREVDLLIAAGGDGRLTFPDHEITGSGPVAIIGNGRQAGGGIQVTPRARLNDGLLDILAVREIPAMALLTAARELQELSPDGEYISYWQTPWAEVHTEEAIPVNLDGEPVQFSNVRYEAVPGAIRLIVAPDCPLL